MPRGDVPGDGRRRVVVGRGDVPGVGSRPAVGERAEGLPVEGERVEGERAEGGRGEVPDVGSRRGEGERAEGQPVEAGSVGGSLGRRRGEGERVEGLPTESGSVGGSLVGGECVEGQPVEGGRVVGRRVVVMGDVIDDVVVVPSGVIRPDTDTPSSIRSAPGGSAANAASWLGSLGVPVDFVGRVGRGDAARHGRLLEHNGVEPHLTEDSTLPTGTIVVLVEGERRAMLTERGANSALHPDQVTDKLLDGAALLHLTGYSVVHSPDHDALARLTARARHAGVKVSVDPASAGDIADYGAERFLRDIEGADVIFPNRDEAMTLAAGVGEVDAAAELLSQRFALVVVTLGAGGVILARNGHAPYRLPAEQVEIVDPTGAGDAFCAGFLAEWLRSGNEVAAARAGIDAGARSARIRGGRPA